MVRLVAFDLDGTLGNTLPLCIASFKKALNQYVPKPLTNEDVERTFGVNEEGMVKMIVKDAWEAPYNDFYKCYKEMHSLCPNPFDGMKEIIADLRDSNLITALVTGRSRPFCDLSLEKFCLTDCFDAIETGVPYKNVKTESLMSLMTRFDVKPEQMIYIGDTVSDVLSCRKAGVLCLSAAWAESADIEGLNCVNQGNVVLDISDLRKRLDRLIFANELF